MRYLFAFTFWAIAGPSCGKGSLLWNSGTHSGSLGAPHLETDSFEITPDRGASDATAAKFPPFQPTRYKFRDGQFHSNSTSGVWWGGAVTL